MLQTEQPSLWIHMAVSKLQTFEFDTQ